MEKICCIFSAGEYSHSPTLPENAFIIAADGGNDVLRKMGITPDISLGDFDSAKYPPSGKIIERHPTRKDFTDTHLAVLKGLEKGFKLFHFYGALGGLMDHTVANLQLLTLLSKNEARGFILDGPTTVTAISDGEYKIEAPARFSVFALSSAAKNVTITGAEYNANSITLTPDNPLGVSNSTDGGATVSVKGGTLHIFITKK